MKLWKIGVPMMMALGCFAIDADAGNTNYVYLQNRDVNPISVDARAGLANPGANGAGCNSLNASATIKIAAKSTEKITVTNERWLCLRLTGTVPWRVEPLAGGKDYSFYVN